MNSAISSATGFNILYTVVPAITITPVQADLGKIKNSIFDEFFPLEIKQMDAKARQPAMSRYLHEHPFSRFALYDQTSRELDTAGQEPLPSQASLRG